MQTNAVELAKVKNNALKYFKNNINKAEILARFTSRLSFVAYLGIEDKEHQDFANLVDYFQYHYVRYLCGKEKTLHRTFYELEQFSKHRWFDNDFFWQMMGEIVVFLEEKEMYESMVLYRNSLPKILKKFNIE